jgi:mannose-6-phosphate isomerase-like protein (cupin superfamily)
MTTEQWEQKLRQQYPDAKWMDDGQFGIAQVKHPNNPVTVTATIVRKPWGYEIWHIFIDLYAWKTLVVLAGKRFSKQLHIRKTETWLISSGNPLVTLGNESFTAQPGQLIHVPAATVHRIEAVDADVELWEVSTPELDDVVRIEDDFSRA